MLLKPQWKPTFEVSKETEHESHYVDTELGISCCIVQSKITTAEPVKPKRFIKIEGDLRTFRSINACLRALLKKRKWKAKA